MDFNFGFARVIDDYLKLTQEIFTLDEFYHHLKSEGVKITKSQALEFLRSSDLVFPLINNEFITRAGVFIGRWFSFKPSKEEIDKGYVILGHRCMPFINPETNPDSIVVIAHNEIVEEKSAVFSMNLAMDTFALFGEGYVIPYVLNDKANTTIPLSSVGYKLPTEVTLTAWPIEAINGENKLEYGDRILCRVINWEDSVIEMNILKNDLKQMIVSEAALQREEWYSYFENGLLENFDRHGPGSSIEEQLALLYLENQEELCIKNCGSAEEFLKHTKKIGFSSFGVETRIWREGEVVPYIGEWNKGYAKELVMADMSMTFSPFVLDAYIENHIYEELKGKKNLESLEELTDKIFPVEMRISQAERKDLLLNIEKRRGILKKDYNQFSEYPIVSVRKRILDLFSQVSKLLCAIGCSGLKIEDFPQQEMIILSQLFSHIVRLIEEVQNTFLREQFPTDDVLLSLEGMEDTFEEVGAILKDSLEYNRSNGFTILGTENKDN